MTVSVVAKRFVNTPTVLELYKEEHPGDDLGVNQDQVNTLSDEYDSVTGNEGYSLYRTVFERVARPYEGREGTEGFFSWVKDTIASLIEKVKSFFKWIWSLVSSKQKALEMKVSGLKNSLKQKGVKTVPTKYPKGYMDLWGKTTAVPPGLSWMVESINHAKSQIGACETYGKNLETFLESVSKDMRPGYIYDAKDAILKQAADLATSNAKTFTGGEKGKVKPFLGTYTVKVDDKGGVHLAVDTKLAGARSKVAEFTSSVSEVNSILTALDSAFTEMDVLNKRLAKLEASILKDLDLILKSTNEGDHGKHKDNVKAVVDTLRDVSSATLATIKQLEQACYKPLTMATTIVTSALGKG